MAGERGQAPSPGTPLWTTGSWRTFATPDGRLLLLSIVLQLALATLLGHSYDTRVFMAAGYLAGSGHNPYLPADLSALFHHALFNANGTVGYPPPWPLLLGLLYSVSHALTPSLFVYNLMIKLPVIAANIGLAYLVAAVVQNRGAAPEVARKIWIFLLFNPFLLYFGAAWGQIDPIVALLALAALVLVWARRWAVSAVVLALAVCFKPIAAPILLVVLVYLLSRSRPQALRYAALFLVCVFAFYLLPFFLLGWSLPAGHLVNAHFAMSGSMSFMAIVRLVRGSVSLPGHWWLLGLAWIPALGAAALTLRRGVGDFDDLVRKSAALVLVFFLTRTWLAEPDVVLVLVLVLIPTSLGSLDRRAFAAIWVVPLLFTVFNASPLRLLWVAFPDPMVRWLGIAGQQYGLAMVIGRGACAAAWQITGWWVVVAFLRRGSAEVTSVDRPPGGRRSRRHAEVVVPVATAHAAGTDGPATESTAPWN
jgi:hypothetical protein